MAKKQVAPDTRRKIWMLREKLNSHDGGEELLGWWTDKPSIEEVATAMGVNMTKGPDDAIVAVVNTWAGVGEPRLHQFGSIYSLGEVPEGPMR